MKRLALLPTFLMLVAMAAVSACADEKPAAEPTAPAPVAAPEARANVAGTAATGGAAAVRTASVCMNYEHDRKGVAAKLEKAPADAELQGKLEALDAIITDACR